MIPADFPMVGARRPEIDRWAVVNDEGDVLYRSPIHDNASAMLAHLRREWPGERFFVWNSWDSSLAEFLSRIGAPRPWKSY